MADFSLTTLFVVPLGNTLPTTGSTNDLTPGQVGFFLPNYSPATDLNIGAAKYFYVAQGQENNYLKGSKRSDKIHTSKVTEWYKVAGCPTPQNQITDISGFSVKCGDVVTLTLRAHSSYINTLYFNGLTRSVTVQAPCCDCGADPCTDTDVPELIDTIIEKLEQGAPGTNPDNVILSDFFIFERVGDDENAILRVHGKPLTEYGQPCDVAAFPHEYDRMWFDAYVYSGPATTADFIVPDNCNIVANVEVVQTSNYATGSSAEIAQLEKNFYSYQAGYMKHLHRNVGYNQNFESYVVDGETYDTFYIKFKPYDANNAWSAAIEMDAQVIIAVPTSLAAGIETVLEAALGSVAADNTCLTTTTTTTAAPTTTTTTTSS